MQSYTLGITKEQFVNEMRLHAKLDHFIKGAYSEGEKGCAVGCGIKSINKLLKKELETSNHSLLETYGICPEWLARVQDTLFEGVSIERSKTWPVEFAEAINKGANLDEIKVSFIIFILNSNIEIQKENLKNTENEEIKKIINQVIDVNKIMIEALKFGDLEIIKAAESARSAAWSARLAAETAARSAAYEKYADELLQLIRECE